MKKNIIQNNKGFSLIELLIAIATGLIILGAIMLTTQSGLKSSVGIQANVAAQQDVRLAMQIMAMEISLASYNINKYRLGQFVNTNCINPTDPDYFKKIWVELTSYSGQNCSVSTATPSDLDKRGIREATPTSITVEADINNDCIVGSGGQQNEVIRYVLVTEGNNQYITRCTCCTTGSTGSGGQPFLGDVLSQGSARAVKVKNADLGIPLFRYYYANGQEFTPNETLTMCNNPNKNGQPLNAHFCNIARIDINIAVETAEKDPLTGGNKNIVISTSVIPRNHLIDM